MAGSWTERARAALDRYDAAQSGAYAGERAAALDLARSVRGLLGELDAPPADAAVSRLPWEPGWSR
jgi:hypothetical protein